jgi:hypothetical protein
MKLLPLFSVLLICALPLLAEDTVTLPKSRLEELQRKEAELDQLKGQLRKVKTDLDKTEGENVELKKQHEEDAAKVAPTPALATALAPAHESPPLASLPPLTKAEPVDAMDLANYYRTDLAAADERFRKKSFQVRGEVTGFETLMIVKTYKILLKTPGRDLQVICSVQPPEKYQAVFSANHGTEMVGTQPRELNETIVRVGDTIIVQGECKGLRDSRVVMAGCELKSIKPGR